MRILSESEISVLFAIDALTFDRILPQLYEISEITNPRLSVPQANLICYRLETLDLVRMVPSDDERPTFALTAKGSDEVQKIINED